MKLIMTVSLIFCVFILNGQKEKAVQVTDLICESFHNPLGIGTDKPRLSWNIETNQRNWVQNAYQIIVASDSINLSKNIGDLWNSNRVESNQNLHVEYMGSPLKSRLECWWKVIVWDNHGKSSAWSSPQYWRIGILGGEAWHAKWIGSDIQLMEYQKFLRGFTDFGMEPENEIWQWAPKIRKMTDTIEKAPAVKAKTYPAKSITFKSDTTVVDFGIELTGWCRMKIKGKKGQSIIIKYPGAPSHTLGRYQTCKYIFKGETEEVYEPRFCYNGFQKVEIIGLDYRPSMYDFTAQVVCTKLPVVGDFACSNEKINQLQSIIRNTIINYNLHHPNDPTREKAGWTQDVQNAFDVTSYNFDCSSMYCKWQQDFLDIQHENGYVPPVAPGRFDGQTINGPWWGGMIVYLPWKLYNYFADQRILEMSYPAMKKYVDYLTSIADSNIVKWGLGDWMEPGSVRPKKTPVQLTSTIAYYHYADIVRQTARLFGKKEDEKIYTALAGKIKEAYNRKFLNDKTGEYALGSQASQLMSLYLGIVPPDKDKIVREALLRRIQADSMHLSTGFVSTPFLLNGLTYLGYPQIAYAMATQNSYPSWFDMVFNHGNSVLKEAWDGGLVQMPSLAGSIGSWFYSTLAGIRPDPSVPGFKKIIIDPISINGLEWAKASYKSIQGTIVSDWKREEDTYTLKVEIPANTDAKVYLPTTDINKIYESGKLVLKSKDFGSICQENGKTVIQIGSGKYLFSIK